MHGLGINYECNNHYACFVFSFLFACSACDLEFHRLVSTRANKNCSIVVQLYSPDIRLQLNGIALNMSHVPLTKLFSVRIYFFPRP